MSKAVEDVDNFEEERETQQVLTSVEELHLQQHHDIAQSTPNVRYGSLWSQYHTLDASTIDLLEQAILYCQVRAFNESLAIYNAFPKEIQLHPIVAFEKCLTFWALWRLRECVDILREALARAGGNGSQGGSSDPGIYTLLRATLGFAQIYTEGDFTQARMSLVEIRKWLLTTSIDRYNDLQVYLIYQLYAIATSD